VTFCEALAEYMHTILPITRPTKAKDSGGRRQLVSRRSQRG
jgi:hypothetical protein